MLGHNILNISSPDIELHLTGQVWIHQLTSAYTLIFDLMSSMEWHNGSSLEHWEIKFVNKIVTPTHGLDVVVGYAMSVNCISYTLPLRMFIQPTRPLAHDIMLEDKEIGDMVILAIALIMLNSMCSNASIL